MLASTSLAHLGFSVSTITFTLDSNDKSTITATLGSALLLTMSDPDAEVTENSSLSAGFQVSQ